MVSQGRTINSSKPSKGCVALAPIMQFYFYIIDINYRCKMVKGTCLAAPQRKIETPRKLDPKNPQ
jgi:hypothetical protein